MRIYYQLCYRSPVSPRLSLDTQEFLSGYQRKPGSHRSKEKDLRNGRKLPGHRSASPVGTLCCLGTLEGGLLKLECAGSHFGDWVQMQMLVQKGWEEPKILHSDRLPVMPVLLVLRQRWEKQVIEHSGEP